MLNVPKYNNPIPKIKIIIEIHLPASNTGLISSAVSITGFNCSSNNTLGFSIISHSSKLGFLLHNVLASSKVISEFSITSSNKTSASIDSVITPTFSAKGIAKKVSMKNVKEVDIKVLPINLENNFKIDLIGFSDPLFSS